MCPEQIDPYGLRLSQVLKTFASDAPWVQIETQRTSIALYRQIQEGTAQAEYGLPYVDLDDSQKTTVDQLAAACTPAFTVPGMNLRMNLTLSQMTSKGWIFRRSGKKESADVEIHVDLVATTLTPAAAYRDLLPSSPANVVGTSKLSAEDRLRCKQLIAEPNFRDGWVRGRKGRGVKVVEDFLSSPRSEEPQGWKRSFFPEIRKMAEREKINDDWSSGRNEAKWFRMAMRTLLKQYFLLSGGLASDVVENQKKAIDALEDPPEFFLEYLQRLQALETQG